MRHLGFLGGQTGPLIAKFEAGYTRWRRELDPNIKVLVEYIGDPRRRSTTRSRARRSPRRCTTTARSIIYHAAGRSGAGLFKRGGTGEQAGDRGGLGSVPDRERGPAAVHLHLDAQAGRHGHLQHDQGGGRRHRSRAAVRCSTWPTTASPTRRRTPSC